MWNTCSPDDNDRLGSTQFSNFWIKRAQNNDFKFIPREPDLSPEEMKKFFRLINSYSPLVWGVSMEDFDKAWAGITIAFNAFGGKRLEMKGNKSETGVIEFLGLWHDTWDRAMPSRLDCKIHDKGQIGRAFKALVDEMKEAGVTSGILAAQCNN